MRSDRERLLDIVEAIGKIEQHASSDIEAFADDEMQQVWVIHHLQIVGEAAYGLPPLRSAIEAILRLSGGT